MKYVSINAHTIRKNAIDGTNKPPIRIAKSKSDAKPVYASEIAILGSATLIYDPSKKIMRCGARMVLVCDDVRIIR